MYFIIEEIGQARPAYWIVSDQIFTNNRPSTIVLLAFWNKDRAQKVCDLLNEELKNPTNETPLH